MIDRIDPIRTDIAQLRQSIAEQTTHFTRVHERLDTVVERLHAVDKRIETVKSDLIAWSFVFWVGAVAAIAMLAKVLDR